jgi:hypothetical protein
MGMDNEPKLYGVLSHQIDEAWPLHAPLLEKAIPYADGKYSLEDIKEGIKERNFQLWAASRNGVPTTVMVTKIIQYPQAKTLLIMLYAGESIREMIRFKPYLYDWAQKMGCTDIYVEGRPGWEKLLKNEGYEKLYSVLRFKL